MARTDRKSGKELQAAVVGAGFREVRLAVHTIPYAFEEGAAQAARAIEASPLAPHVAKLPLARQAELSTALASRFARYLDGGTVRLAMESNLVVGVR